MTEKCENCGQVIPRCDVCDRDFPISYLTEIKHPTKNHFWVCVRCQGRGYITNLGWIRE